MSITVSSTSDTQEQVNLAAGVETPPEAPPAEAPAPVKEQKPPYEPDEDEGDEEEPDESEEQPTKDTPPPPKKKGGYLRKIEALQRDNGYAWRRIEDLEAALVATRRPAGEQRQTEATPRQAEAQGKPVQDQFERYEDYIEALTDWKVTTREAQQREQMRQWQEQEQQRLALDGWQRKLHQFRQKTQDFDEVLALADPSRLNPGLHHAMLESEIGPELLYELAKNPAEFQRINALSHAAANREAGRIEERILARAAPPSNNGQTFVPSKAPPPIRPLGQGAGVPPAKRLDEMDYQEFKRAREKQIAARRGR